MLKLEELFEYNHVMNEQLIQLLNKHIDNVSEKSFKLLSHMLNAHQIWNARILQKPPFQVWQLNNWQDINPINLDNYTNSLNILISEDLTREIEYSNSAGQRFKNKIEDILFHIINHSTYHRAQIATECRIYGIEPLSADYIIYKRMQH